MRLYDLLLRLYPASFRNEYGREMRAIFVQHRRDAHGAAARAALWIETLADVVSNATRVHLDILGQDLRYAARTLTRTPGFSVTVVLVTALGLGATTAAFSIADHVLLRPLPFPHADRLVKLWHDETVRGYSRVEVSPPNYRDWKRLATSFDVMAAHTSISANLVGGSPAAAPIRLDGASATWELFDVLGVRAAIGRTFEARDGETGAQPVVILSAPLWTTYFGADPAVIGRKVLLDDEPHVVIGVMPADFFFPDREVDFWTPKHFVPRYGDDDRRNLYLRVVARLRTGATLERARTEMRLVAAQLEREYPENDGVGATVIRIRDEIAPQARQLLVALTAASVCVLLIACVNLSSLMLSRALSRQKELAVRLALGAGSDRLVRQMLTESCVLAAIGGVVGVLLALGAAPLVARLVPNTLPVAELPPVDARLLAFAAIVTISTGVLFGVAPALRVRRNTTPAGLREGGRTGQSIRTTRLRAALVVAEVSGCVVLLVSAGLLARALWRVQSTDPGFRSDRVVTLRTTLPLPKYSQVSRRAQFYERVVAEVEALPGIERAAYISFLPMTMRGGIWPATTKQTRPEEEHSVSLRFVTPGFFNALSIPLDRGRDVAPSDTLQSQMVAVVSQSFAREHWPGLDPLGRTFNVAFFDRTVVGVVGNVRVRGLERESEPQVYLPYKQVPDEALAFYTPKDLVVRAAVEPTPLIPAIREVIARADAQQPVSDVRLLRDVVAADSAPRAVQAKALGAFAAIAFVLAALGIYGLLAFDVSNRLREFGVRLALGASATDILLLVMRRGVLLAAAGIASGVPLAYAAAQTMRSLLAGVSPADWVTLAAVVTLAVVMTVIGSLVPALRAARSDPLDALRAE